LQESQKCRVPASYAARPGGKGFQFPRQGAGQTKRRRFHKQSSGSGSGRRVSKNTPDSQKIMDGLKKAFKSTSKTETCRVVRDYSGRDRK